jgi:hypothetical protein
MIRLGMLMEIAMRRPKGKMMKSAKMMSESEREREHGVSWLNVSSEATSTSSAVVAMATDDTSDDDGDDEDCDDE